MRVKEICRILCDRSKMKADMLVEMVMFSRAAFSQIAEIPLARRRTSLQFI